MPSALIPVLLFGAPAPLLLTSGVALLSGIGPAAAQAPGPRATWRSATHEGYARLVLDMPRAVAFQAATEGSQLVIRFQEPVAVDLNDAALGRLAGKLRNPRSSADGRVVTFDLIKPITLRSFPNQRSAVFDLVDLPNAAPFPVPVAPAVPATPAPVVAAAPAPVPVAPAAAQGPRVPVRLGVHDNFSRLVFDWPNGTDYELNSRDGLAEIRFTAAGQPDLAAIRGSLPRSIGTIDAQARGGGTQVTMTVPASATLRHFKNGNSVVIDVIAPSNSPAIAALPQGNAAPAPAPVPVPPPAPLAVAAPAPVAQPAGAPNAVAPAVAGAPQPVAPAPLPVISAPSLPSMAAAPGPAPVAAPAAAANVEPAAVSVSLQQTPGGPRLRFAFAQPPAAALFVRGGGLYVLFDHAASFDLAPLRGPKGQPVTGGFGMPEPIAVEQGAAVRLPVPSSGNLQLLRESDGWVLTIRPGARRPNLPLSIALEGDGPRVQIATANPGPAIRVPDPEGGAPLFVVPLPTAGAGVETARQFPQFSLLPTAQGVLVMANADGVQVSTTAQGVAIGTGTLMVVSGEGNARSLANRVFDFSRWLQPDLGFIETQQALQRAVIEAEPAQRAMARFELAQFLLARDHASDAIGVLDLIAAEQPAMAQDPALKALRGAARMMMGDGRAAAADLDDPQIANDPSVIPLRAAARVQQRAWDDADRLFRQGALPPGYSPAMRQELMLAQAESALEAKDPTRARGLIDKLRADPLPAYAGRIDVLLARAMIAGGDKVRGLALARRLSESTDPWSRVHGEFLMVQAKLDDSSMPPKEAIDRLDRLRFAWSGDRLQFDILRRLGDLEIEQGDFRAGLNRLREAVNFFPNEPETKAIKAKMVDTFVDLYTEGSGRGVPALTALSLFDDFRDLTPTGPRGDRMIQRLADRLVEVDLLDRAAALLDYQVRNRLAGPERARIGARLAIVDMLDAKPEAALAALEASAEKNLPADLLGERRVLKARALLESGNSEAAIAELQGDQSREADELRAELYSRAQNWSKAADALTRLAGKPGDGPFPPERQRTVLNLAVATAMAGDNAGLQRLRDQFGTVMAAGSNKDAFGMVTSVGQPGSAVTAATVASRLTELQEFQSSVTSYRAKLNGTAKPAAGAQGGTAPTGAAAAPAAPGNG